MLEGSILITGGAGYLGKAIIKKATEEKWSCNITIYSTDPVKHIKIRNEFPHVNSIIGDIRENVTLYNAMSGMDIVIHAAAVKHIDISEYNSIDTFDINVNGSLNVLDCATQLGISKVIGISTDKACNAANAYGASKYAMEKFYQEYSRMGFKTTYHLVRYGNVIDSTASVLSKWKQLNDAGKPIKITNPAMTRFWLSPSQAVRYISEALEMESGHIYVPKLPSLSIGKLADYAIGDCEKESMPIRPGEKMHEMLITKDEVDFVEVLAGFFNLSPSTEPRMYDGKVFPYTSCRSRTLTREELWELLND